MSENTEINGGEVRAVPMLVTADDLNAHYKSEQAQRWTPVVADDCGDASVVYTSTPDPEQIIQSTRDIAQQTPEGLLPAEGVTQAELEHWMIQHQQERAAVWVRKILMKDNTLFTQNDSGAYQLSEWFTKHIGRVNELDVEEFLRWLPQRNEALANAVQRPSGGIEFVGHTPLMLRGENGEFPGEYHPSKPAIILGSLYDAHFENIRTQFDAVVATEILLALRDWRKEQERQLEAKILAEQEARYWAYRSSF